MKKLIVPLMIAAFPVVAAAQDLQNDILPEIRTIIDALIPIIIGIAILVFLWGILKYVVAKSEDEQKEARNIIIWGVIVLFVMVSIWGLVNLLSDTLGLDINNVPDGPGLPTS